MIPLNPRLQPVKLFVVIPVYVITSFSILKRPNSFGNPFVLTTSMVVDEVSMSLVSFVSPTTTSGVKLSNFMY